MREIAEEAGAVAGDRYRAESIATVELSPMRGARRRYLPSPRAANCTIEESISHSTGATSSV